MLENASLLVLQDDPQEEEHLQLVAHHPGFREAVEGLGADLEVVYDWRYDVLDAARADPSSAPYPARQLAHEWGISPAAAIAVALMGVEKLDQVARDRSGITVWETPEAFTIQISRPLTPQRYERVTELMKEKRQAVGPIEEARGKTGKRRGDPSPALIEALVWFDRWIDGEEPASIWRDVQKDRPKLGHDAFVRQLTRVWERMRSISENDLPRERPSKRRG